MQDYLASLKKWNDFNGRATRKEFWIYYLVTNAVPFSLLVWGRIQAPVWAPYGVPLLIILILVMNIAVLIRRLHDTDRSGWLYFIRFIPVIGPIYQLIWMCTDGTVGPNKYGPDPKNRAAPVKTGATS